ncbi:MoaD/ThiS family protein [Thermodesulfobacteriota bacterium]
MEIELRLFASLARYLPDQTEGKSVIMEIDKGKTVKDIVEKMGVPLEEVKLIFINGIRSGIESSLKDKDRLGLFPPVAGG